MTDDLYRSWYEHVTGVAPSLDASVLNQLRREATRWEDLLARATLQDDDHVIKSTGLGSSLR